MIVNFLIALIDESNRIAKSIKKDPDFLEFIIFSIKVLFKLTNSFKKQCFISLFSVLLLQTEGEAQTSGSEDERVC